jgi:1-deoxy-D-xylulose-5-phosphate synthase
MPKPAEVTAIPYGTWEILREGSECAILAVGVMCEPALEAADLLAAEGLKPTVVNCRFIKPMDHAMLEGIVSDHRLLLTVEDGVVVNGFGACVAAAVESMAPEVRLGLLGAPDCTIEHAARAEQLEQAGLTGKGIAAKMRVLAGEGSLSTA